MVSVIHGIRYLSSISSAPSLLPNQVLSLITGFFPSHDFDASPLKFPLEINTTRTAVYLEHCISNTLRFRLMEYTHAAVAAKTSARLAFVKSPTTTAKGTVKEANRANRPFAAVTKFNSSN